MQQTLPRVLPVRSAFTLLRPNLSLILRSTSPSFTSNSIIFFFNVAFRDYIFPRIEIRHREHVYPKCKDKNYLFSNVIYDHRRYVIKQQAIVNIVARMFLLSKSMSLKKVYRKIEKLHCLIIIFCGN
jgi:hypothetical protein